MPIVHLVAAVLIVLAFVGLCWYLLDKRVPAGDIKTVANFLIVLALVLWLLLWAMPRFLALV